MDTEGKKKVIPESQRNHKVPWAWTALLGSWEAQVSVAGPYTKGAEQHLLCWAGWDGAAAAAPVYVLIKQWTLCEYREPSGIVKLPSQMATWLSPKGSEKKHSLYSKQPRACKRNTVLWGDESKPLLPQGSTTKTLCPGYSRRSHAVWDCTLEHRWWDKLTDQKQL